MTNHVPGANCTSPEHHQFDFWIGDWEVRDRNGEIAGHNSISRTVGGCALLERWRGREGLVGMSINAWSTERKVWHQTWVDSAGTLLLLEGGLRDGVMVLEGTTVDPEAIGGLLRHRISWSVTNGTSDRLRQHWETCRDGKQWESAFDGAYTRITS